MDLNTDLHSRRILKKNLKRFKKRRSLSECWKDCKMCCESGQRRRKLTDATGGGGVSSIECDVEEQRGVFSIEEMDSIGCRNIFQMVERQ